MANILNKCPICGGKLEQGSLYQYTRYHTIGKSGKVLRKGARREDNGPMEASFIVCVNEDFMTDCEYTVTVPNDSGIEISQHNDILYWESEENDNE